MPVRVDVAPSAPSVMVIWASASRPHDYRLHIADDELARKMRAIRAILIEGPSPGRPTATLLTDAKKVTRWLSQPPEWVRDLDVFKRDDRRVPRSDQAH